MSNRIVLHHTTSPMRLIGTSADLQELGIAPGISLVSLTTMNSLRGQAATRYHREVIP